MEAANGCGRPRIANASGSLRRNESPNSNFCELPRSCRCVFSSHHEVMNSIHQSPAPSEADAVAINEGRRPRVGVALALILCALIGLKIFERESPLNRQRERPGLERGDIALSDECLEPMIDGWRKVKFAEAPPPESLPEQQFWWTHAWHYIKKADPALVAFDQANWSGWHELSECYSGAGWSMDSRKVICPEPENWPYVVSRFSKGPTRSGIVVFSMFFNDGAPVPPPDFSVQQAINRDMTFVERIGKRLVKTGRRDKSRQCQVFYSQHGEISQQTEKSLIQLHLRSRRQILTRWLDQAEAEK